MSQTIYSARVTLTLGRIQRILSRNGVSLRLSDGWSFEQLHGYCAEFNDDELARQLAILEVEMGQAEAVAA